MTRRERRDPYLVLGVSPQASAAEVARAYRRAARASHPDSGAGSAERFQAVSEAYDELRDAGRRALHDRSHPLPEPQTAEARRASVRYAAPGSQHVVLGRHAAAHPRLPFRDVEELFRVAVSFLRAGW